MVFPFFIYVPIFINEICLGHPHKDDVEIIPDFRAYLYLSGFLFTHDGFYVVYERVVTPCISYMQDVGADLCSSANILYVISIF